MVEEIFYFLGDKAIVLQINPSSYSLENQLRILHLEKLLHTFPEVVDTTLGMNNITVVFKSAEKLVLRGVKLIKTLWQRTVNIDLKSTPNILKIPVIYGGKYGPDLKTVAHYAKLDINQVVKLHSETVYTVWFLGFRLGFPYLGGLSEELIMPRRKNPRIKIPQGSIGIGGIHTGIYSVASPSGWQIIGTTHFPLFNFNNKEIVSLKPGDKVSFVPQKEGIC